MDNRVIVFSLVLIFFVSLLIKGSAADSQVSLQKSMELVGVGPARAAGLEGQGIKVGVIDTGIDYNHPSLFGYGPSGKVAGGFDYVDPGARPLDTNGHGTEVAGIISADGNFSGVAPKAKLYAYKVSSTGEGVSSNLIVKAIQQAVRDGVNVINISLGINKTNAEIDDAIDYAAKKGIVVVVAAGNNGPEEDSIGSPGMDANAITVGASYNNLTSSLVATLQVNRTQYQVLPMIGSGEPDGPIKARIIYGSYGRLVDLKNVDVKNSILLEERGSDIRGQKVYFSEKEKNAASLGARALIVFNNDSGIFAGELVEPNKTGVYTPSIPVISMSKEDGLQLRSLLSSPTSGTLDIFYHPDFVAPFSSEGPVSPFYIKPDLVAPGVFVNSTTLGGKYNITSGTSFAAPHVAGAAAIILQKHPSLSPIDVASLLVTTTDPVTDAYGRLFPIDAVGSGRLNITRALEANLIIIPRSLVFDLSFGNMSQTDQLHIRTVDGSPVPDFIPTFSSDEQGLAFSSLQSNSTLSVTISDKSRKVGDFDGFITLNDSKVTYRIPVITHVTNGTISVSQGSGRLGFSLNSPDDWNYAKITLINSATGERSVTSITPGSKASLPVYERGQYWVLAQISGQNRTDEAYKTVFVDQVSKRNPLDPQNFGIPQRQVVMVSAIIVAVAIVGLAAASRRKLGPRPGAYNLG